MKRILVALVLSFTASGCATLSEIDSGLPPDFHSRFKKYPVWITTAFYDAPGIKFPGITFLVSKKWTVHSADNGRTYIERYASSSAVSQLDDHERHKKMWLDGAIDPRAFLPHSNQRFADVRTWEADRYSFRDINGKSFEIAINSGRGRVVFSPAPNNYLMATDVFDGLDQGIWVTPFGSELEVITQIAGRTDNPQLQAAIAKEIADQGSRYFLHHDISGNRKVNVAIDWTVPEQYLSAVDRAVQSWNEAIGNRALRAGRRQEAIDLSRCLTEQIICIRWKGPPEFSYRGLEGVAHVAFDPQSGLITGAIVTVINDRNRTGESLVPLPKKEQNRAVSGDLPLATIAEMMIKSSHYLKIEHPDPEKATEATIVHELGHALGLGHNFAVNSRGKATNPTLSIMSYPPFPVTHLFTKPTPTDQAIIRALYKQERTQPTSHCATFDAMSPRFSEGMWYRPYNCGMGTLGDKVDWLIALSKSGKQGVLTTYPDKDDQSPEQIRRAEERRKYFAQPPHNILTEVGLALAEKSGIPARDRRRLAAFLCESDEIDLVRAQLTEYHRVELSCP